MNSGVGLSGLAEESADEDAGDLEYIGGPVEVAEAAGGTTVVGDDAGEPLDF